MGAKRRRVLIVGGGIAGLTTAIALGRDGHAVEVLEVRDDWAVAGWGLSLTGPALRALDGLGLADDLIALGFGITAISNCDRDGNSLADLPLPSVLGPDRPSQVGIARTDLALVVRESAASLGAVLRTSLSVAQTIERGASLSAILTDGTTRDVDIVVVADGVDSRTRGLLGITATPTYTGQMAWRAVVRRPEWADRLFTFVGPRDTAGLIPISDRYAYCFLTENVASPDVIPDHELAAQLRDRLVPFGGRMAEIRESIGSPRDVVRRAVTTLLVDLPWNAGRVVLVGDAAHTTSPQLVCGAALAIEDAVVLADELARTTETLIALERFGRRRHERAQRVVDASHEVARLEHAGRHREVAALLRRTHGALAEAI